MTCWGVPSWVVCGMVSLTALCALAIPLVFFNTKAGRNSYLSTMTVLSVLVYGIVVYLITTREVRVGRTIAQLVAEAASGPALVYGTSEASVSFSSRPSTSSRRLENGSVDATTKVIRRLQAQRKRRVNRQDDESDVSSADRTIALRDEVMRVVWDEPNFSKVVEPSKLEQKCVSSEMRKFIFGLRLVGREAALLSKYHAAVTEAIRANAPPPAPVSDNQPSTPTTIVHGAGRLPKFGSSPMAGSPSSSPAPATALSPLSGADDVCDPVEESSTVTSTSDDDNGVFQSVLGTPADRL